MIGCRCPSGELVAGQRDVDALLAQPPVELGAARAPARARRPTPRSAAGGRSASSPSRGRGRSRKRLRQLGLSTQVADARILDLVDGRGRLDRAQSLGFERLGVHAGDCTIGPRERSQPVRRDRAALRPLERERHRGHRLLRRGGARGGRAGGRARVRHRAGSRFRSRRPACGVIGVDGSLGDARGRARARARGRGRGAPRPAPRRPARAAGRRARAARRSSRSARSCT